MRIGFDSRRTRDPSRFTATLGGDPNITAIFKGDLLGTQARLPQQPNTLREDRKPATQ